MATRPSDLPRWATDAGSRVEPPEGKKDEGWQEGEKPPAGFFNWLSGVVGDWLAWLKEVTVHREDNLLGVHGLRAGSDGVGSAGPVLSSDFVSAPHMVAHRASDSPALQGLNESNGTGVYGYSREGLGVRGLGAVAGVFGEGVANAPGVKGVGVRGVIGESTNDTISVGGSTINGAGVFGSAHGDGAGVVGQADGTGAGVSAEATGNAVPLRINGTGSTRGDIHFIPRSQPSNGQRGQVYFDAGSNKLRVHDGTTWRTVQFE